MMSVPNDNYENGIGDRCEPGHWTGLRAGVGEEWDARDGGRAESRTVGGGCG